MKTTYGLPKKTEEVIEALQAAFTEQNLDEKEYDRRLGEAIRSESIEELRLVIFDFPKSIQQRIFPPLAESPVPVYSTPMPVETGMSATSQRVVLSNEKHQISIIDGQAQSYSSFLGEQRVDFRKAQVVGNSFQIRTECFLGSTLLDLRNENFQGSVIRIRIDGALGDVKILLPHGVEVDRNLSLVLSDFSVKDKKRSWLDRLTGKPEPNTVNHRYKVLIEGTFILGSVQVVY